MTLQEYLDKNYTKEEQKNLTVLYCYSNNLTSLKGVENLTNLKNVESDFGDNIIELKKQAKIDTAKKIFNI